MIRRHCSRRRRLDQSFLNQRWTFCGEALRWDGKIHPVQLFYASEVAIKRRLKIRGQANPYDPAWEMYFEHRLGVKMASDLKGRRQLLYLWRQQDGLCPICRQKITQLTGWHSHHLVQRSHGGSDSAKNRVLLHPHCHRQVHSLSLEVTKPRPAMGV